MNHELKMAARKLFYRGITKGVYEKLSASHIAMNADLDDEAYIRKRFAENVGGGDIGFGQSQNAE